MIKVYPDRPVAALLRVLADVVTTGWTVAWAVLGWLIYKAVLAYRAVSTLRFRQLMSASSDPVGDIAERRYERLADAMLKRAGLDPGRLAPPELPELPAHREGREGREGRHRRR